MSSALTLDYIRDSDRSIIVFEYGVASCSEHPENTAIVGEEVGCGVSFFLLASFCMLA